MTLRFPISTTLIRVTAIGAASFLLVAAGTAPSATTAAFAGAAADIAAVTDTTEIAAEIAANDDLVVAPADAAGAPRAASTPPGAASGRADSPVRLAAMIDGMGPADSSGDADLRCLATAVYFEARGEPLEGQLAVAQAILNRAASGRYPSSACGVIGQPGQFSFSRARPPAGGSDWRVAQAIARIAAGQSFRQVAPRAISFHASFVKPGWSGMTRVAQIGNHVFYR